MLAKLELRDRRALAAWRPDSPRRRLGGVLALPAALWSLGRMAAYYFEPPLSIVSPAEHSLVFDVPKGVSLAYLGMVFGDLPNPYTGPPIGRATIIFMDLASESVLLLNWQYGGETNRDFHPALSASERQALSKIFDLIAESTWLRE